VEARVPTVSEIVRKAVAMTDPDGQDDIAVELLEAFEDDDRAAPGLGDSLAEEIRTTVEGLDPEADSAAGAMAGAVAVFLATKPEGGDDPADTFRVAAHVAWHGNPPANVQDWLAEHGAAG